jgi:signal transduction histidine kinase
VRRHLSARSRLTLLYATLFTLGGAALVLITYLLTADTLHSTAAPRVSQGVQQTIAKCLEAAQTGGAAVMQKCGAVYTNGVQAGAAAQRSTTLTHLLTYSLLSLAGAAALAGLAGWIVAGRILRPVHQLTAAARAASEQDLSQRIALHGPRDELRELADTFDAMLERLDRAFTSQRQFIANASHELRTPLTVMRTAMDVVLAKPEPTREELVSMAAEIRQAVDHSERLIDVLLVLARNDQARALTDPLDLADVAEDALDGRTGGGLTMTTALGEAPVTGDRVLLERLIANLLDNAERYNIAGGTVTISTAAENGASMVRVANTGRVVPPDQVERLFLPFTRLDDRTRHEGFGLGLALVSSIATVHNGTVDAAAVPTGGLDITIRLPRRDTVVAPAPPAD